MEHKDGAGMRIRIVVSAVHARRLVSMRQVVLGHVAFSFS